MQRASRFREYLLVPLCLSLVALTACIAPASTGNDPTPTPAEGASPTPPDSGGTPTPSPSPTPEGGSQSTPFPDARTGFYVVGSFPQDGAMAVPGQLLIQVYFSEPWQGELSLIRAELRGDRSGRVDTLATPILAETGSAIQFPAELWAEDIGFTLHVEIAANELLDGKWPIVYEAHFTTGSVPCDATFDVYQGLTVERFGGNDVLVKELNRMLNQEGSDYPTALFLVGIPETIYFPVELFDSALAPVYPAGEGLYSIYPDTGVTSQIGGCSIDGRGAYRCEAERGVLPLKLYSTTTLYLYLEDIVLSADLEASGALSAMNDFELTGYMLGTDLYQLLASVGYDYLAETVELDVDSDGDGFADAASVQMSSQPVPIDLMQCF